MRSSDESTNHKLNMNHTMKSRFHPIALTACFAATLLSAAAESAEDQRTPPKGAVYTMDNAGGANHVWAFTRAANGALGTPTIVATGGAGTGTALGNQGAIQLSRDGHWLVVCNAGSDELSVFYVTDQGLTLTDKVSSQGRQPISITLHDDLLYVLNAGGEAGGADSIAGFVLAYGHLFPLPGATSGLSGPNTGPAEVAFTQDGSTLVVTEKGTGLIDTFLVGDDGVAEGAKMFSSPAPPPYGFAAGIDNRIFVTQAAGGGGNPGASSVSSYQVQDDGSLRTISDSVATHQTAACWLVLTSDQRFAYAANTPNDSLSSFSVVPNGKLQLLQSRAALPGTGSHPGEMGLSANNRFLYALDGNGTISAFSVNLFNGSLQATSSTTGLPTTVNGMAVR